MIRPITLIAASAALAGALAIRARATASSPVASVMRDYGSSLFQLDAALRDVAAAAARRDVSSTREKLAHARLAYKRVEWLAEHYTPLTAAALNGPALDRPDDENPKVVIRPTGLQVMSVLLSNPAPSARELDSVALETRVAMVNVRRLRERAAETSVTSSQLFDAARLQLARIVTLGIAGFDGAEGAIGESDESLRTIGRAIEALAGGTAAADSLRNAITVAHQYLDSHRDFDAFDRFAFITEHANPIARLIAAAQTAAAVPRLNDPRAWSARAATVFDHDAFVAEAFATPGTATPTPELVSLGERLFSEPRLSGAGDRSCATCHRPELAFTDGRRYPTLITPSHGAATPPVRRNTPTLYNAALQTAAFADARVAFLEDQVAVVVASPREMAGNLERAADMLRRDTTYARAFDQLLERSSEASSVVQTTRRMRQALAAYMRTLVRLDSRFDRAIRGEERLSATERNGFNLFMGKGRCGTCHFAPLFNGVVPPGFATAEVEVLGVPGTDARASDIDRDRGAGAVDGVPMHEHAFKTPTVRNAAVTAPYMHNGVFTTLDAVLDFYDRGGARTSVPNQTLPRDSLHLTAREKKDIISFIEALTDTSSVRRR